MEDEKIMKTIDVYDIDKIIERVPSGQRWIQHLNEDLLPFWIMDEALKTENGLFPTYRTNKGETLPQDPYMWPEEFQLAKEMKELVQPDRLYLRMHSRQTYAYGVAYHLTGNSKYLNYCYKGVQGIIKAIDDDGGVFSFWLKSKSEWGPSRLQRTSQDISYALAGLGFYYYLTHDAETLDHIKKIKDYIFDVYYDPEANFLKWVVKENKEDGYQPNQKELVSHLDQIYAYMLWLTPSLPEKMQNEWIKTLQMVANIIIEQFFSEKYQLFWGAITNSTTKKLGTPHTDFGHSIKTLWLIYQIGKLTNNLSYVNFAKKKAINIINVAYIPENGSWGRRFDEYGRFDNDKEWWGLAELDQTTATLSLVDPSYARYLVTTYDYWFTYMVDYENHEIWHMVDGDTNKPVLKYPKQHSWKNCYHSFEHALIGYLTGQQLKNMPIELYYAFDDEKEITSKRIHPYFYNGKICNKPESNVVGTWNNLKMYKIIFSDLH